MILELIVEKYYLAPRETFLFETDCTNLKGEEALQFVMADNLLANTPAILIDIF